MGVIVSSLKQSFKSLPFVFKKTTVYFGFYYLALSILYLFLFSPSQEMPESEFSMPFYFDLSKVFLVFIVPYYTYTHIKGSENQQAFWPFVAKKAWPLVINNIKAFFVILLFLLLLIIPGIYKAIRYTFLNHAVFFDDLTKRPGSSALKAADQTTRGYFWWIVLFFILTFILNLLILFLSFVYFYLLHTLSVSQQIATLILTFYIPCFQRLWWTCFYFEIKKAKGEAVSC